MDFLNNDLLWYVFFTDILLGCGVYAGVGALAWRLFTGRPTTEMIEELSTKDEIIIFLMLLVLASFFAYARCYETEFGQSLLSFMIASTTITFLVSAVFLNRACVGNVDWWSWPALTTLITTCLLYSAGLYFVNYVLFAS